MPSGLWNHLITVVILAAESDGLTELALTLASLRAQCYRNIELLVAGGPSDLPADLLDFSGHRGLFLEPALRPLEILTSPSTDRIWRGSHVVFARAGTQFAPDAFVLLNKALNDALGDASDDPAGHARHGEPRRQRVARFVQMNWPMVGGGAMIRRLLRRAAGLASGLAKRWRLRRPRGVPIPPRDGLCISGYLRSEIGLGQAARNLAYASDSQRLPLSFRHLPLPGREADTEFNTKCNEIADRKANLLVIGLPSICHLPNELDRGLVNILYPFWELSRVPGEWLPLVRRFDEIWTPTNFVASQFPDTLGRPVRLVRLPLRLPSAVPPPRSGRDTLRVLTYLDFDSYGARKNPTGAVNVFRAAFEAARRDVELVVKIRGTQDNGLRRWLGETAALDQRIKVIDRTFDRRQMDELIASCDVLLSLHRSEGYGLGAAEALAAGKAVVATNYGGTTDFITPETGYPIDYVLEAVQPGQYVNTDGQVWAAPLQEAAAAALRLIYDDPAQAVARTLRGFALLQSQNSLAAVGTEIARLLGDLGVL